MFLNLCTNKSIKQLWTLGHIQTVFHCQNATDNLLSPVFLNECTLLPAGTTSGLSLTGICRLWVYQRDMTACSKRKHPGQSTVGKQTTHYNGSE